MKNKDIVSLYCLLNSGVLKDVKGTELNYLLCENLDALKKEADAIRASNHPSIKYCEYDMERVKLCEKYAVMINGKPQTDDGNYIINPAKKLDFDKSLKILQDKYSTDVDIEEKRKIEYAEFLNKENVKFKPTYIDKKLLPKDLTGEQMSAIYPFMKH